jgi:hypothetical protein
VKRSKRGIMGVKPNPGANCQLKMLLATRALRNCVCQHRPRSLVETCPSIDQDFLTFRGQLIDISIFHDIALDNELVDLAPASSRQKL